jgi:hypothetical protein
MAYSSLVRFLANRAMKSTDRIRIIKHEAVPGCGSFEVRFPDDRPSQYFYWDDIPARRLRPEMLDHATTLEQAKAVARAAETR